MQVESEATENAAAKDGVRRLEQACRGNLEHAYRARFADLRPEVELQSVTVSFRRYASASARISIDRGRIEVRIADTLAAAPDNIHGALADILVSKLLKCPVPRDSNTLYRRYLRRPEVRRQLEMVRSIRGRKHLSAPAGQHYNLEELFELLNHRYFFGLMAKPTLGWSRRASKTLLGHYDPSHNTIVISCLLDRATVPQLAIEYVLYHEMLHMRHPVEQHGSRRCVHTKGFKLEERQFEGFLEAKRLLRELPLDSPSAWSSES